MFSLCETFHSCMYTQQSLYLSESHLNHCGFETFIFMSHKHVPLPTCSPYLWAPIAKGLCQDTTNSSNTFVEEITFSLYSN